jgi:phosphatidylserine synthase
MSIRSPNQRFVLLREALAPPNALTLLSANLALCGMWQLPGLAWAAWAVFGCIVLDVLDGRVARATGGGSPPGAHQ